jgi:hypothetical protein
VPQPPGVSLTVLVVLQFVKEYFVVFSALAIIVGVVLATIFLNAYLSVFDWQLLWIGQYPDILTFALVGWSPSRLGTALRAIANLLLRSDCLQARLELKCFGPNSGRSAKISFMF